MEYDSSAISPSDRAAYEKLPAPMCILKTQKGVWSLVLESDGLLRLVGRSRGAVPVGGDPLPCVFAGDRELARSAWEYAVIYPGEESVSVYRLNRAPEGELGVSCRAHAQRLPDGTSILYLFFTEKPADSGVATGTADALRRQSAEGAFEQGLGEYRIAKLRADLTANRTLEYTALSSRALQISAGGSFDEAAAQLSRVPSFPEYREKLAALLSREELIRRYAEGEMNFSLQYRRDENGLMPFWVCTTVSTLRTAEGRIECVINTYDVTEKILEGQILSRLTALGYEVVGLLYVHTGKCRFFRIKKLRFGMNYEQYEDYQESIEDSMDVILPEQRGAVRSSLLLDTIVRRLEEEPIYSYSYSMTTSDGRRLQKLLQFSYLDERRDTIFLCKSDITRQYRSEHEQIELLRKAKLDADRANEAKSSFLSSMSHDLRTPLNGIIGFTNLALHEPAPARKQEYLEKVRSSSELLLDLVNDTLELSRIESGKFVLAPEAVKISDMAETVLTALGPSAEIKGLRIVRDPEQFPEETVWADKLKFQKIFLNLLSNAIKYTQSGGTITVSAVLLDPPVAERNFRLTVRDTGIGITPEFLPHIFDAFSQEHRPETANILGTGLGLAIVRKIVGLMGGGISVTSTPGSGSVFQVDLPLRITQASAQPEETLAAAGTLSGKRVLLCEDNNLNTEIAKILLEEQGMQIRCAENGKIGAEMFRCSRPGFFSAILMDIRMPVMDGYEATRLIRSMDRPDARTIPILAMTADAFEEDIRSCREAGMNGHVTKPIDPKRLLQLLGEEISRRKNG